MFANFFRLTLNLGLFHIGHMHVQRDQLQLEKSESCAKRVPRHSENGSFFSTKEGHFEIYQFNSKIPNITLLLGFIEFLVLMKYMINNF